MHYSPAKLATCFLAFAKIAHKRREQAEQPSVLFTLHLSR